jgi:hypothetical protein
MTWHWYEDYERGRPGYPPELVAIGALPSSATVLELAYTDPDRVCVAALWRLEASPGRATIRPVSSSQALAVSTQSGPVVTGRIPVIVATPEVFGSCDGSWSARSGAAA